MKISTPAGDHTGLTDAVALSQPEAVAAVLVAGVAADGVFGAEEARRLHEVLSTTRWAFGLGEEAVAAVARRGLGLVARRGWPAVLEVSAQAIPVDLHPTVFALAVDLMLADGRLGSREGALIDQLQAALRIDAPLARAVLDVLLVKNRASGRPDV